MSVSKDLMRSLKRSTFENAKYNLKNMGEKTGSLEEFFSKTPDNKRK